ncbi:unnamed protein product, partial [Urochloa humidicola]
DPDPFGAGDRSSAASPARPPSKEVEEGGGGSILSPNGAGAVAAPFFPACSPSVILTSPFESKVLDPETGRRRFPRRGSSASINETQDMTESNFCHSRPGCKFSLRTQGADEPATSMQVAPDHENEMQLDYFGRRPNCSLLSKICSHS